MQTQPNSLHLESLALCFRTSALPAADSLLAPASISVMGLSGRDYSDIKCSWLANHPVWHQDVCWPAERPVSTTSMPYFKLTTQLSPMTKLGKNISETVVVQNNITTPFACQGMIAQEGLAGGQGSMDTGAVVMYPFQATILRRPGTHLAPSEDLVSEME